MAAEVETLTLDSQPPQSQPEKVSVSFSIWPPTQRTRVAVLNLLIETLFLRPLRALQALRPVVLLLVPSPTTCAASPDLKQQESSSVWDPCLELWFDPPSKEGLSEEEVKAKQDDKYECGVQLGILHGYQRVYIPPRYVRQLLLKMPKYKNNQTDLDRCMSYFMRPYNPETDDIISAMSPLDRQAAAISAMSRLCPVMLVY
ncbi:hypothetical protein RJ640_004960 [Escallonia rubra]|uniref:Uncharacterized protein n=1 Tax=Escallonia rubra TaxID=112253 RepID=A0AA88U5Z9_9ASTE|nr:hypothetical protein RJ640_004960 [Escallonia rubra]